MKIEYIGVKAKNQKETCDFQRALFCKGFQWVNSGVVVLNKHTNFYARLSDRKIITCYHDHSIDDESVFLTVAEILNLGVS